MAQQFETWELQGICIRNNWFTGGSCESYDKLFEMCKEGATIKEIALVIWVCTPNSDRNLIYAELLKKHIALEIDKWMMELSNCIKMPAEKVKDITGIISDLREEYDRVNKSIEQYMSEKGGES